MTRKPQTANREPQTANRKPQTAYIHLGCFFTKAEMIPTEPEQVMLLREQKQESLNSSLSYIYI